MHLISPIAIRELVNTREVAESLNSLSNLTGYRIHVTDPEELDANRFTLGKDLFEFDIYGYWKGWVAFEPIVDRQPFTNLKDTVALVRDILTRAYEIDDLAAAEQQSSDQIGNLVRFAKMDMTKPEIDGIMTLFLREVSQLVGSNVAFAAIAVAPTIPYTVQRLVGGGAVEKIAIAPEGNDELAKLCDILEQEKVDFRRWKRDDCPIIVSQLLDNSTDDLFTSPLRISNQSLGCFGVSASIDNAETQHWLTIYMAFASGAIAGAIWRQMEVEKEKAVMEAREEVARHVIHLMDNHLVATQGNLKRLRKVSSEPEPELALLGTYAERLSKNLHDASQVISEFRALTAADTPKLELTDINRVLVGFVEEMRQAYREKFVFNEEYAAELPPIQLDTARFRRVLDELIANASQYVGEKGHIRIRTAIASETDKGRLNLPIERDCVAIEFSDDGEGVSEENKEKIFQSGFTTRSLGTGIGLAYVKKYIEDHQGKIAEVGKLGEGATFLMALPIQSEK